MKTSVLRDFFSGKCSGEILALDLSGGVERVSVDSVNHYIDDDFETDFVVTSEMLTKVGHSFLGGVLDATSVQQIAFATMASDYFDWDSETADGERVAKAIGWWDSPDINFPITDLTVRKTLHYLKTGEETFTRSDLADGQKPGRKRK